MFLSRIETCTPEFAADNPCEFGSDRFYLSVAEYESDIWVMDLEWE